MKIKFFILVLGIITSNLFAADLSNFKSVEVVDGDTLAIELNCSCLPSTLTRMKIRIKGVNTPEIGSHAQCQAEAAAGEAAKKVTQELIAQAKKIEIKNVRWDKYGGRIDGDVYLDDKSLSETLIVVGAGESYDGGARTQVRCESGAK